MTAAELLVDRVPRRSAVVDVLRDVPELAIDVLRIPLQAAARRVDAARVRPPHLLFRAMRAFPVAPVRDGRLVITRYDEVVAVLTDRRFSVAPYALPMRHLVGDFVLGTDVGDGHGHERDELRKALLPADLGRCRSLAAAAVEEVLPAHRAWGVLDAVRLTDSVMTRFAESYLGVPNPAGKQLPELLRPVYGAIFTLSPDLGAEQRGAAAARELKDHVAERVQARSAAASAGGDGQQTVLDRLLRQGMTQEDVVRNLVGLLVGAVPTVAKALPLLLDELLRRPAALSGACAAAGRGDDELLRRHLWEALRFAPHNPGLVRRLNSDGPLWIGGRTLDPGTEVIAVTQSAMMDESVVTAAREYRLDRPDGHYLHHGAGPHTCLGEQLTAALLCGTAGPLLARRPRRAQGPAGRLALSGNWPVRLGLEVARDA